MKDYNPLIILTTPITMATVTGIWLLCMQFLSNNQNKVWYTIHKKLKECSMSPYGG